MTVLPPKYLFFKLNDDLELKLSITAFVVSMSLMALITIFANIFALFSFPLYLGIIFAVVSDRLEYRTEGLNFFEEE